MRFLAEQMRYQAHLSSLAYVLCRVWCSKSLRGPAFGNLSWPSVDVSMISLDVIAKAESFVTWRGCCAAAANDVLELCLHSEYFGADLKTSL